MKRTLTSAEIEDICDQIQINPSIPFETAVAVRDGLVRGIESQLKEIQIYPEGIPELKKEVMLEYHRSLLQPGEMVGVQAATSIGEPVTQMSLNAFHYSGISTIGIASGVPRVEEILNASKKQKMNIMNLYFNEKKSIEQAREHAYSKMIEVYLSNLCTRITARYVGRFSDLDEGDEMWYRLFFSIFSNNVMDETGEFDLNWMVRFELDRDLLYKHRITTLDIAEKIEQEFRDLYVVASPDTIGMIDVYVDFKGIKMKKTDNKFEQFKGFSIESRCIQNVVIPYLKDIQISGMTNIEDIQLQEERGEWAVMTKGSNLYAAFKDEELDFTRCRSSDLWEIFRVLGVEACRQFIIEEFYKVLSSGGASVGRRHIELLADSMTYQGKISSVNRYGIDRNQIGPMAKASFEESVRNFFIAAVNGETDQMGVSASLMAGRLVKCGTGFMEMVLNEDMLKKATFHRPRPIQQSQPPVYARPTRVAQPERVYKMEKKEEAKVLPPIVLRASAKVEATPASVLPNLLTGKSVYEQKQILPGLNPEPVKEKISFMKKQKPKPVHKDIVVDFEED
jgi:DNA-directed RNA polymerase II subunit RPB1